jgi:hypothetical protein
MVPSISTEHAVPQEIRRPKRKSGAINKKGKCVPKSENTATIYHSLTLEISTLENYFKG